MIILHENEEQTILYVQLSDGREIGLIDAFCHSDQDGVAVEDSFTGDVPLLDILESDSEVLQLWENESVLVKCENGIIELSAFGYTFKKEDEND